MASPNMKKRKADEGPPTSGAKKMKALYESAELLLNESNAMAVPHEIVNDGVPVRSQSDSAFVPPAIASSSLLSLPSAHYLAGLSLSSSWNLPAPSSLPDVLTSSALILPNQIGASREISPYSALPNQLVASPPSPFSSPHAGGAQDAHAITHLLSLKTSSDRLSGSGTLQRSGLFNSFGLNSTLNRTQHLERRSSSSGRMTSGGTLPFSLTGSANLSISHFLQNPSFTGELLPAPATTQKPLIVRVKVATAHQKPAAFRSAPPELLQASNDDQSLTDSGNTRSALTSANTMIAPPSAMTAPSATAFGERSPSDPSIAAAPTKRYVLQVLKHPPAKALYRRTLKPAPVVALLPIDESTPSDATSTIPSLLVEAVLVRSSPGSDIEEELPTDGLLDGVTSVPVAPGGFASFKKLKIMCTSQQMGGAFFRVKFKLSRYISGEPIRPPGNREICTVSNPVEVFSHSQYLNNKNAGVVETIPARGPKSGGTRVAVLGYNFVESENLRVKFGESIVPCQFHDNCTLLCTSPPLHETRASSEQSGASGNSCTVEVLDLSTGYRSHIPAKFLYH